MIKIEKAKKEGLKETLTFKALLDGEYFIASLSGNYPEPMTGKATGKDGREFEWNLYDINVHEIVDIDVKKLVKNENKFAEPKNCSMFSTTGTTIQKAIKDLGFGVKFKVTMEENPETGKKYYKVEILDKVETKPVESQPKTAEKQPMADKIKQLKGLGVDVNSVIAVVKNEYGAAEPAIKALYEAM